MAVAKRPKLITYLCALLITGIVFSFPKILFPSIRSRGDLVPMIYGLIITLRFIATIGIWHMKKWGVQFFIATFFMNLIFEICLDMADPMLFVFSIINITFIILFLLQYKRMSDNL